MVARYFVAYISLLLLVACANPLKAPSTPQEAINEANILLTAASNVIAQNLDDGIYTKEEAQKYLDKVRDLSKKVDDAQRLVTAGLPDAKQQVEIVRTLVLALHREVASRARKVSAAPTVCATTLATMTLRYHGVKQ